MIVHADLKKLQEHQDLLQQELHTCDRLLESLQQQCRLAEETLDDTAAFYQRHIRFVRGFKEKTSQMKKLLADAYSTLNEANKILGEKSSDAEYLIMQEF